MPVNVTKVKPGDLLVYTSGRQRDIGSVVQVLRVIDNDGDDWMLEIKWVKPAAYSSRWEGEMNTLYCWRFEPYFGTLNEKLTPIEMKIRMMATRHESRRKYA